MSLHHLVKFRTIIVTSLLQKYYNKCFNEEIRRQTKTAKLTNLLSVFFTALSFCVIFIVKVYTVLIKIYTVFFKWEKVGGFKNSRLLGGCEKNQLLSFS